MTKTLTEQWREGTLQDGEYYVKDWDGKIDWFVAQNKILWRDNNNPFYASERIEVLAPVPSYEEYKRLVSKTEQLEKKLEIATKALKEIRKGIEDFNDDPMNKIGFMAYGTLHECLKKSKKALKEMEGVK